MEKSSAFTPTPLPSAVLHPFASRTNSLHSWCHLSYTHYALHSPIYLSSPPITFSRPLIPFHSQISPNAPEHPPFHTPTNTPQRRHKSHLTPTKQRVPPPKNKHLKPPHQLPIHPNQTSILVVRFNTYLNWKRYIHFLMRRQGGIRPDTTGVRAV